MAQNKYIDDPFDMSQEEDNIVDPFDQRYYHEDAGFSGFFEELGDMLGGFPTHVKASVARYMEGLDPEEIYSKQDWKDKAIAEAERLTQEEMTKPGQEQPILGFMKRGHFRETGPSLGFSGTAAGAGLGAGLGGFLTGSLASPAVGAVTGYAAGAGASGHSAYSMSGNEFLRRGVDMAAEAYKEEHGEEMSTDQKLALAHKFVPYAKQYGLWEAIPEAASNVVGFKLLAAPMKSIFGEGTLRRFLGKAGALYGEELLTEVITQIGQHNVEIEAGMSDEQRREFDDLRDWQASAGEVLAPTLIQTTLMAGTVGAGVKAYKHFRPDDVPEAKAEAEDQADTARQVMEADTVSGAQAVADELVDSAFETPKGELVSLAPEATEAGLLDVGGEVTPEERTELESYFAPTITYEEEAPAISPAIEDETPDISPAIEAPVEPEAIEAPVETPEEAPDISPDISPPIVTEEEEKFAAKQEEIERESAAAATSPKNDLPEPTPDQIEKGNYQKGHPRLHGFDVSIESAKGSIRRSKPGAAEQWEQEMAHDYGYLRGTVGHDKDHLDVFLGPHAADESLPIFVVDQVNPKTGKFDEHKVVFGARDGFEAMDIYESNYHEGWQGFDAVTEFTEEEFSQWARDKELTQKPAKSELSIRERLKQRQEEQRAEEIREDAGQVQAGRPERPGGEGQGRADLQQPAEAEPETRDEEEALETRESILEEGLERLAGQMRETWAGHPEREAADRRRFEKGYNDFVDGKPEDRSEFWPYQDGWETGRVAQKLGIETKKPEQKPEEVAGEPEAPDIFLAELPAETVIEEETGTKHTVKGAEKARYDEYNERIKALIDLLECVG